MLDFAHDLIFPPQKISAGKKGKKFFFFFEAAPFAPFRAENGVKNTLRAFRRFYRPKGQPHRKA